MRSGAVAAALIGAEPAPDEILHQSALLAAVFEKRLIVEIGGDPRGLAVEQQVGHAVFAGAGVGVRELPFGTGHRAVRDSAAKPIFRQPRPEP